MLSSMSPPCIYYYQKMQSTCQSSDSEGKAHEFLEYYCLNCESGKYSEYELYYVFATWSNEHGIGEREKCRVLSAAYSLLGR
jgi:hypothetical protein